MVQNIAISKGMTKTAFSIKGGSSVRCFAYHFAQPFPSKYRYLAPTFFVIPEASCHRGLAFCRLISHYLRTTNTRKGNHKPVHFTIMKTQTLMTALMRLMMVSLCFGGGGHQIKAKWAQSISPRPAPDIHLEMKAGSEALKPRWFNISF